MKKILVMLALAFAWAVRAEEKQLGGVQLWKNGPYWAECNVGATKPEEYGYYFWWGDTVGCKRNSAGNGWVAVKDGASFSFGSGNTPTHGKDNSTLQSLGYIDSTGNLVATHDAATVHLDLDRLHRLVRPLLVLHAVFGQLRRRVVPLLQFEPFQSVQLQPLRRAVCSSTSRICQ